MADCPREKGKAPFESEESTMATKYRDGERQFSTDSDDVAKFAIKHGLLSEKKPNTWCSLLKWAGALPFVGRLFRLLGGDFPSGP